jgi:hypothetical protein
MAWTLIPANSFFEDSSMENCFQKCSLTYGAQGHGCPTAPDMDNTCCHAVMSILFIIRITLQHPAALCILKYHSHFSPSLCNFIDVLKCTLQKHSFLPIIPTWQQFPLHLYTWWW